MNAGEGTTGRTCRNIFIWSFIVNAWIGSLFFLFPHTISEYFFPEPPRDILNFFDLWRVYGCAEIVLSLIQFSTPLSSSVIVVTGFLHLFNAAVLLHLSEYVFLQAYPLFLSAMLYMLSGTYFVWAGGRRRVVQRARDPGDLSTSLKNIAVDADVDAAPAPLVEEHTDPANSESLLMPARGHASVVAGVANTTATAVYQDSIDNNNNNNNDSSGNAAKKPRSEDEMFNRLRQKFLEREEGERQQLRAGVGGGISATAAATAPTTTSPDFLERLKGIFGSGDGKPAMASSSPSSSSSSSSMSSSSSSSSSSSDSNSDMFARLRRNFMEKDGKK